jgi:hypothetical protein
MEQIGKRVNISGSEIRISSPKNVFMLIFLPIWLTGWTIGGIIAIGVLVTGGVKEAWFLLFWLCGWAVGESFALYALLWGAFGHEVITVKNGIISIKRSVLGYGPSKHYYIDKLSNLRASGFCFDDDLEFRDGLLGSLWRHRNISMAEDNFLFLIQQKKQFLKTPPFLQTR